MEETDFQVEMETMQISNPGSKAAGYSLVESIIAVFLASTLLLALMGFSINTVRVIQKNSSRIERLILAQNESITDKYPDNMIE